MKRKVLITLQVEKSFRDAVMDKAEKKSINISAYLRKKLEEFIGKEQKSAKDIMKSYGISTNKI